MLHIIYKLLVSSMTCDDKNDSTWTFISIRQSNLLK